MREFWFENAGVRLFAIENGEGRAIDDPLHPAEVSDLYAENIPDCSVAPASTTDVAAEIGSFCSRLTFG